MGGDEVNALLSSLAIYDRVSASTQDQALNALLYLYRHVLQEPLPWLQDEGKARSRHDAPRIRDRAVASPSRGHPRAAQ
jgi:hypothetical protein